MLLKFCFSVLLLLCEALCYHGGEHFYYERAQINFQPNFYGQDAVAGSINMNLVFRSVQKIKMNNTPILSHKPRYDLSIIELRIRISCGTLSLNIYFLASHIAVCNRLLTKCHYIFKEHLFRMLNWPQLLVFQQINYLGSNLMFL